ncbi:pentapeptide repeat-containing protein [Streptomyces sp. NPDC056402]|uniref:pentapeptide repeat-containing protein n=1 Tax=Streptomyces sp. NPDC056402 TaxID=3345810 RepID=UPI0035DD4508
MAALAAALFTWVQVGQAGKELRISTEGQITNRFNTAVTNLGAPSLPVRVGGIYALGRIMLDSPHDLPAVTSVLSAYIRDKAPLPAKEPGQSTKESSPPADVTAALTILANRPGSNPVDLANVNLRGLRKESVLNAELALRNFQSADFSGSNLRDVDLDEFDFKYANFNDANLSNAFLTRSDLSSCAGYGVNLTEVTLVGSNLSKANMDYANLTDAVLSTATYTIEWRTNGGPIQRAGSANLTDAGLGGANLTSADLRGVNLTRTKLMGANLTDANLAGATLRGADLTNDSVYGTTKLTRTSFKAADLRGADLQGVDLRSADLRGADLRGARLAGALLRGAKVDKRTRGVPASAV